MLNLKSVFIACLLNVICTGAFAQIASDTLDKKANYIINANSYKVGIYTSFEEFKYNSPSIVDHYTFDGRRFRTERNGIKKKIKRKTIWGYSDGKHLYACWNRYPEITVKGRYCYFQEKGIGIMTFLVPPFFIPIPVPYSDHVIINYNTGATYLLNTRLLKKILETDPELLSEFHQEKSKKKVLLEYIVRYNARNQSGID
jgi:hypothetical protein